MASIVEIDGGYLEGGGQILRNALSLSSILQRPVRVINIRSNRPNPGLSNQHLFGLNLLQQITNARVKGNFMKSTEVEFCPSEINSGNYTIDTRTAASISLVLQAALPVLIFGPSSTHLKLFGGTNVGMAPQIDFLTEVVAPNLKFFGVSFDVDIIRRGFYPRGGGECVVIIPPVKAIEAAQIVKFGYLKDVVGICFVAGNLPVHLAEEMKTAAISELQLGSKHPLNIKHYKDNRARDNGAGVIMKAITTEGRVVGSSALGERRINAQEMGTNAAKDLRTYIDGNICVDRFVQDQLIIFMALGNGISRIHTCELTNHTKTAIHVAERLAGVKFNVTEKENGNVILECQGLGLLNKTVIFEQ